jgi:crossover junction endonuclease MUS81
MKIIVDEREAALYEICLNHENNNKDSFLLEKRVLQLGDILFTNDDESITFLCIERKSLQDLLSSIKDGRYKEQSYRLSNCYPNRHNVVYLLEGMLSTVKDKQLVISCIASLNYFKGFSVHRTVSMAETATYILCMADKMSREFKKGTCVENDVTNVATNLGASAVSTDYCNVVKVSKKANITKENMGAMLLMQVPGVSSSTAVEIMRPFSSFVEFIDHVRALPEYLGQVTLGEKKRKIGSNIVKGIEELILGK